MHFFQTALSLSSIGRIFSSSGKVQISNDNMVKHCGTTTVECVVQWVQRSVAKCEKDTGTLCDTDCGEPVDLKSILELLVQSLKFTEASRDVAQYVLSWQNMEKSIHYASHGGRDDVLGPLSPSTITNLREIQSEAHSLSVICKCLIAALSAVGEGLLTCGLYEDEDSWNRSLEAREGVDEGRPSFLLTLTKQFGYEGRFARGTVLDCILSLAKHYKHFYTIENASNLLLSLISYCLVDSYLIDTNELSSIFESYLDIPRAKVITWAIAPLLDSATENNNALQQAIILCKEYGVCSLLPMSYVERFLTLGAPDVALGLMYQKYIDPECTADVLCCIRILLFNGLLLECFVQIKQFLGYIPSSSYQKKARCYWHEMFRHGATHGLLFQLIKLPITVNEEEFFIGWLIEASQNTEDAIYTKILCLYYIIRGRIDEAAQFYSKAELDSEKEWDAYLEQLMQLSLQCSMSKTAAGSHLLSQREPQTHQRRSVVPQDRRESEEQAPVSSGLLFGGHPIGNRNQSASPMGVGIQINQSPSHIGSKLRRYGSHQNSGGAHTLDKLLGLA